MIDPIEQQMLLEIREDPADDHKRLIYADYMEDTRRFKRAEFIRIQIELARLSNQYTPMGQREKLQTRQSELFKNWDATGSVGDLGGIGDKLFSGYNQKEPKRCIFGISEELSGRLHLSFQWVRGFISNVYLREGDLDGYLLRILDQFPIEHVGLSDKIVACANSLKTSWYWQMRTVTDPHGTICELVKNVFDRLARNRTKIDCKKWTGDRDGYRRVYYKSEQDALLDLSHAILLYGKELRALKAARNSKPFIFEKHVGEPEHKGPGMFAVYEAWKSGQGEKS